MLHRGLLLFLGITCLTLMSCKRSSVAESDVEMARGTLARGTEPFVRSFVSLHMLREKNEYYGCSGVVLGPRQILTAAHCVEGAKSIEVVSFDEKLRQKTTIASAWQQHSDYQKYRKKGGINSVKGDMAIVIVPSDVPGPYAKISASRDSNIRDGIYVGVGLREGNKADEKIRYAKNIEASRYRARPDGGVWMSRGAAVLCSGDSGGPLFASDGALLGVSSIVTHEAGKKHDCGNGSKVFHADVQENIVWIVCSYAMAGHPLAGYPIPSADSCR